MLDNPWILAQQAEPMIRRLDPESRIKALAALGGLVILGLTMIVLIWLVGRATRRYMSSGPGTDRPRSNATNDDWARKPLSPPRDRSSSTEG